MDLFERADHAQSLEVVVAVAGVAPHGIRAAQQALLDIAADGARSDPHHPGQVF